MIPKSMAMVAILLTVTLTAPRAAAQEEGEAAEVAAPEVTEVPGGDLPEEEVVTPSGESPLGGPFGSVVSNTEEGGPGLTGAAPPATEPIAGAPVGGTSTAPGPLGTPPTGGEPPASTPPPVNAEFAPPAPQQGPAQLASAEGGLMRGVGAPGARDPLASDADPTARLPVEANARQEAMSRQIGDRVMRQGLDLDDAEKKYLSDLHARGGSTALEDFGQRMDRRLQSSAETSSYGFRFLPQSELDVRTGYQPYQIYRRDGPPDKGYFGAVNLR